MAGRPKGLPKTGGRQKGTPNKATVAVKEAFRAAFDDLGGTAALVEWAKENPTQFYQLFSKLIPTEVDATISGKAGAPAVQVQIVKSEG
ncbi:hypothetical protein AWB73_00112 [Caballeronia turbans]|nr:hypothetical protein AWB73_00112 [Caballeronia turbans]